ncbi:MAG: tRNA lysidine(34) synthetase TilS [Oscillospiraceae bacterium]|nr:tRNA lysidine(34) synthetase TilS [Oscillospiraceae bacterium]
MRPLDAVRAFLREQGIRDTAVTAALSGGADSVCLLRCLRECAGAFGLRLSAIHVQHGLRGAESLRDEQFCRALCAEWDIPLTVVNVDVKRNGRSLEEAARECRYAAFEAHAEGYVATAHTASDNFETMLFRLVRGTGLKGLAGIPPVRERYLRPLLHVSRDEVEMYLQENGIGFVTDSSNLSEDYARNFLRHRVVPLLQEQNPALMQTAAETTDILRTEEDFLAEAAADAYAQALQPDGSLRGLRALHPALQRRCIRRFLQENGLRAGYPQVTAVQALLDHGGRTELERGGTWVCVSRGMLFTERSAPAEKALVIGKNCLFPGVSVEAALVLREDAEKFSSVHKKFTDFALDYDIIKGCARLHSRQPGLRMIPAGRTHHVSVKKWLNECVPPAKRQQIHYLSDDNGLLWIEGLGAAAHAAVTEQTQRMLVLDIHVSHT